MSLLKSLFKSKEDSTQKNVFVSPVNGTVYDLSKVPDDVFSQKILGEGFSADSNDGDVFAPCSGEVGMIFPTKHAIIIKTDLGLEVLIHMGIDTVKLDGAGFDIFVEVGQRVEAGEKIAHMDLDLFRNSGYKVCIPVILTNLEQGKEVKVTEGKAEAGEHGRISIA